MRARKLGPPSNMEWIMNWYSAIRILDRVRYEIKCQCAESYRFPLFDAQKPRVFKLQMLPEKFSCFRKKISGGKLVFFITETQ